MLRPVLSLLVAGLLRRLGYDAWAARMAFVAIGALLAHVERRHAPDA